MCWDRNVPWRYGIQRSSGPEPLWREESLEVFSNGVWWEVAVVEHDTILERRFQDLAHALEDQLLEFGGHVAKSSLSHERDNAFDTGSVVCTMYNHFVLEEISDTRPVVRVEGVITRRAISLCVESSENAVVCSHLSFGGGTVLPVIPSVSDIRAGFEDMVASASYTRETLR